MNTVALRPSAYKRVSEYFSEISERTANVYMDVYTQSYIVQCKAPAMGLSTVAEYQTLIAATEHAVSFIKGETN